MRGRGTTASQDFLRIDSSVKYFSTYRLPSDLKVPTIQEAKDMPAHVCEVSNSTLLLLCELNVPAAIEERLVRNVMTVNNIEWPEAKAVVRKIQAAAVANKWLTFFPHQVGIAGALSSAVVCVPMIYHLPTALWFNERYVTTDVPEDKDIESFWEVSSWTWGWMEPALGTASFILLALQFARSQMLHMNIAPYTEFMLTRRASRLVQLYPDLDPEVLTAFGKTAHLRQSCSHDKLFDK